MPSLFFALPIVWLLLESTRTQQAATSGPVLGFGSLGQLRLNWQVLTAVFGELGTWVGNSALYSGSGVLMAVGLGIPAGYGLATFEFVGRRPLLIATMIAMLIPSNALVLPLVLEANTLKMISSPIAVILPYGLFPFGVYIAYLYFNTPRVHGLIAAARATAAASGRPSAMSRYRSRRPSSGSSSFSTSSRAGRTTSCRGRCIGRTRCRVASP